MKRQTKTLGRFSNFPTMFHGIAKVRHAETSFRVQRATIRAFHDLNSYQEDRLLSGSEPGQTHHGKLGFEVGVAEDLYFNYLDEEEVQRVSKHLSSRRRYRFLDFLLIVTYRYTRKRKQVALNFDYHYLRFTFSGGGFEVLLYHSKGTRRMPLNELLIRLFNTINNRMKRLSLGTLTVEDVRTL